MAAKWKIFAVANYILLLFYSFLFVKILQYIIEDLPSSETLFPLIPMIASLFMIPVNTVFNLYVFHFRMPRKPLSATLHVCYMISAVLYTAALGYILYETNKTWNDLERVNPKSGAITLMQFIFFITLVLGIFILVNQLLARKYILRDQRSTVDKLIEDIGK